MLSRENPLIFKEMFKTMTSTKQHTKMLFVGDGAVGSSYAFALVLTKELHKLGILSILHNCMKAVGDARLTLVTPLPSLHLKKSMQLNTLTVQTDLVVITAGAHLKNQVKLVLLVGVNLAINKSIVTQVVESGFKGIFPLLLLTLDVLTYSTWKFSLFPIKNAIVSGVLHLTQLVSQALFEK